VENVHSLHRGEKGGKRCKGTHTVQSENRHTGQATHIAAQRSFAKLLPAQ
jgi:hypothetical protein